MGRTILTAAMLLSAVALGEVPAGAPVLIGPEPVIVRGGVGNQTDPHVSASVVSYTNLNGTSSEIRYQDLDDPSSDLSIPNSGNRDSLSDVSGNIIVFRRVYTDGTTTRSILFYDRSHPELGIRELSPEPGTRRAFASVGGDTVAFMQFVAGSSTQTEICVSSITAWTAPAQCLTNDGLSNRDPAVSPDGSTIAWAKCQLDGTGCDIYVARKSALGTWGAPVQLTDSLGEDILPDTNGTIVTYASNAGGDYDIWYQNVDGTNERQLVLSDAPGSTETNPNIAGDLIAFERELPGSLNADLYVYELSTRTLFHLRDTPDIDETLNDISVDGAQAWVVWASPDGITEGQNDVWAATFTIASEPPCEDDGGSSGGDDDDDGHHDGDGCDGHHGDDDDDDNHHHHGRHHGNEGTSASDICANPGTRPVLGSVTVTRTRGKPNTARVNFTANEGEDGVVCIYNNRATSGSVHLNGRAIASSSSFKHQVSIIGREAELKANNRIEAAISGAPGTSYEVRVYGETNACLSASGKRDTGAFDLKNADDIASFAAELNLPGSPGAMRTIKGYRVNSLDNGMRVLDSDDVVATPMALGCSTSDGSAMAMGVMLLLVLWTLNRRTPVRVTFKRRR